MKTSKLLLFTLAFAALSFTVIQPVSSQDKIDFSKNGEIHEQVIHSWNTHYRAYFASEINKRLFQEGDIYVLYSVQSGLQSFVEMTRRCNDTKQIAELVDLLNPVFSALKPISSDDNSTGWLCTGGKICTDYNFLGKEVMLCSSQFLGLLGALATTISQNIPPDQRTAAEKSFLANTFNAMAIHLNRWLTPDHFIAVNKRLDMTPDDVKDGSSRYFFSDKDLWHLTALSDLAELHQSGIQPLDEDGKKAFEDLQSKKDGIRNIFDLFLARTFLTKSSKGTRAEIDKGFWTNFYDQRYAKYTGPKPPVSWEEVGDGKWKMNTDVKWDSTYLSEDAAWDISHTRRLVPALETFARNQKNIKKVWAYDNPDFDPLAIRQAYANQIAEKIWNGDTQYPLFTNFWSGDNGWYRVAYAAKETGSRFSGYPPYGLSASMPQGGYAIWGVFHPTLRTIFRNIFELSQADDPKASAFISKNYSGLAGGSSDDKIKNLSFLSDLVELHSTDSNR